MNTNVSTPQNILEKTNSPDYVYTYIHTYMEKRRREESTRNTNVIFYDGNDLEKLKEIAFRSKTDVSSIISNITREFVLLMKSETPQRTLFNFEEKPDLLFDVDEREAEFYLRQLSKTDFKKWAAKLQMWMNLERKVVTQR